MALQIGANMTLIIAYALMIPGSLFLAFDQYNRRSYGIAAVFALYGLGSMLAMLGVTFTLTNATDETLNTVTLLTAPLAAVQAAIMLWIAGAAMWKEWRDDP